MLLVYLDLLFVDEKYRSNDIGTYLIKQVELFAQGNKCVGIKAEIWIFQARNFYEKMGFTICGELDNHPSHAIDYFFKMVLITNENEFSKPISK